MVKGQTLGTGTSFRYLGAVASHLGSKSGSLKDCTSQIGDITTNLLDQR